MKESSKKTFTKRDVAGFLSDLAEQVVQSQGNYLHSVVFLNELLRQPNAEKIFDDELKAQAKDLWIKIKAGGLELNDPPLLFGVPDSAEN